MVIPFNLKPRKRKGAFPSESANRMRVGKKNIWMLIILFVGLLIPENPAQAEPRDRIQAAFIYKFTKFIQWPVQALDKSGGRFPVCVAGHGSMEEALREIEGQRVGDRPIVITGDFNPTAGQNCLILFVDRSESENWSILRKAMQGKAGLLIGDWPGFAASGGHIQFFMESDHVGFAINLKEVRASGLNISAKLLQLARIIETQ